MLREDLSQSVITSQSDVSDPPLPPPSSLHERKIECKQSAPMRGDQNILKATQKKKKLLRHARAERDHISPSMRLKHEEEEEEEVSRRWHTWWRNSNSSR